MVTRATRLPELCLILDPLMPRSLSASDQKPGTSRRVVEAKGLDEHRTQHLQCQPSNLVPRSLVCPMVVVVPITFLVRWQRYEFAAIVAKEVLGVQ